MAKSTVDKGVFNVDNDAAAFVADGLISDISEFVDTGSYILNAAVSGSVFGGYPRNIVTAIGGDPATGKTFLCLDAVGAFHQKYANGLVAWFDSEQAVSTADFKTRANIDMNRVKVFPVMTVEQFRHEVVKMLDNYMKLSESDRFPLLFVLDSLGNLSTSKETADMTEGKETKDMTRAQLIKGAFRVITTKLGVANCPMLVTNHIYTPMGQMFPQPTMGGGSGILYCASNIIMLGKAKEKDGTEVIGNKIRCKMHKSRKTRENRVVSSRIFYETGIDRYYGLLPLAEEHGIVKKDGKKLQFHGSDKSYFEKAIYANPEKHFTDEIMAFLDHAAHREFMYGNAYETWCEEVGLSPTEDIIKQAAGGWEKPS